MVKCYFSVRYVGSIGAQQVMMDVAWNIMMSNDYSVQIAPVGYAACSDCDDLSSG